MSLDFSLEMEVDTGGEKPHVVYLYDGNITHNVTDMWKKAGVYDALYDREGAKAGDILDNLIQGLTRMMLSPDEYKKLNARNLWGTYEDAFSFLKEVTEACKNHPKATIRISK